MARRAPFPLYGLAPDWRGRREVGSGGAGLGEVTDIGLRHRTGAYGGPEVVVKTLLGQEGLTDLAPFAAALHLDAGQPYDGWAADVVDPERVTARHEGRWRPSTFSVDGRDQVFWSQAVGERWAAFARVGGVRVVVAGTRWDPAEVRLAVVDPAGYLSTARGGSTTSR